MDCLNTPGPIAGRRNTSQTAPSSPRGGKAHALSFHLHTPRRRPYRGRRGSIILETAVAVALLATAAVALSKLAQSAAQLQSQRDQQVAATLAADNLLAQIRMLPGETRPQQTEQASKRLSEQVGLPLHVTTTPFQQKGRQCLHLHVAVGPRDNPLVTRQDWFLADADSSPERDTNAELDEDAAANDSPADDRDVSDSGSTADDGGDQDED